MNKSVWFVVHQFHLWDIDNRLIGFWKESQWSQLRIDDLIIYYRAGEKNIKGIFRVIKKGVSINSGFSSADIKENTIYQCRLELLTDDIHCFRPTTEKAFSFYDEWRSNRFGGRGKQCFRANYKDLKLITNNTSFLDLLKDSESIFNTNDAAKNSSSFVSERSGPIQNQDIIHEESIFAEDSFDEVQLNITEILQDYMDLFRFDDKVKKVFFKTEGPLLPLQNERIPVLILLSNPHPHSVRQGMFLSPDIAGRENPFWRTLRSSDGVDGTVTADSNAMLSNLYRSHFRFFMTVLISFPSKMPEHLPDILGQSILRKMINSGIQNVRNLILNNKIRYVICFGKMQFEAITSTSSMSGYTKDLQSGQVIYKTAFFSDDTTAYLTYPTGWRYGADSHSLKRDSLRRIFLDILKKHEKENDSI